MYLRGKGGMEGERKKRERKRIYIQIHFRGKKGRHLFFFGWLRGVILCLNYMQLLGQHLQAYLEKRNTSCQNREKSDKKNII